MARGVVREFAMVVVMAMMMVLMRWSGNRIYCGRLRGIERCGNMRISVGARAEMVGTVAPICVIIRRIPREGE